MALTEYKIKVIDANNKPLLNFPMATQYVGGDKKNNKLTDDKLTKTTKHAKRHFWLTDVCTCHGLLPSHSA